MDGRIFDGVFKALILIGILIGAAGATICIYVIPYFWRHLHWH